MPQLMSQNKWFISKSVAIYSKNFTGATIDRLFTIVDHLDQERVLLNQNELKLPD